jgi:hypothetical protein
VAEDAGGASSVEGGRAEGRICGWNHGATIKLSFLKKKKISNVFTVKCVLFLSKSNENLKL